MSAVRLKNTGRYRIRPPAQPAEISASNVKIVLQTMDRESNIALPIRPQGAGTAATACNESTSGTVLRLSGLGGGVRRIGDQILCTQLLPETRQRLAECGWGGDDLETSPRSGSERPKVGERHLGDRHAMEQDTVRGEQPPQLVEVAGEVGGLPFAAHLRRLKFGRHDFGRLPDHDDDRLAFDASCGRTRPTAWISAPVV